MNALTSSKTFCAAPWVHFLTLPDGTILPCCRGKEAIRKPGGDGYNVRRERAADIWNGEGFQRLRQALLNGEETPHCTDCYRTERNGFASYRELFNQKYIKAASEDGRDGFLDRLIDPKDPLIARRPIFFDIRLDNICNLKCRMCGPNLSSQIEKDAVATAWVAHGPKERIGEISDAPEGLKMLAALKDFCLDAVRLELIGGEPTLSRGQMELLKHFADKGIAHQIELLMITNMTNAQDGIYRTISKFRQPNVHISMESTGTVNEYIRFPIKWDRMTANIAKVRAKYPNISFGISPTFQAYNVLYLCDLFDWCLEQNIPFTSGNILSYPDWLSVCVLPMPMRVVAAERIEAWVATHPDNRANHHDILALAGYLRDEKHQATDADIDNFVRYTNDLDRTRGQDIRLSLPEFYALWTAHRPWDHGALRHYGRKSEPVAKAPAGARDDEVGTWVTFDHETGEVIEPSEPTVERAGGRLPTPIAEMSAQAPVFHTIDDILTFAREAIATTTGLPIQSVKLGLKIDYQSGA